MISIIRIKKFIRLTINFLDFMKTTRLSDNIGLVSIILILLTVLVFANTLKNGFVYDDSAYVVHNHHIRDISHFFSYFTSLQTYQSTGAEGQFKVYRPLVTASFALDYAIWKLNPVGYHLTNILLHALAGILIYICVIMLFRNSMIAFISALIFLMHPVQVEAVSWISGRGNMLYAIFSILTLIAWIRYTQCLKKQYIIYALLFYTLALFSKEMALSVIPLMALAFMFMPNNDSIKSLIMRLIPFIIISIAYLIIRTTVIGAITQRELWGGSYDATFATMTKVLLMYWIKLLLPLKLNVLPRVTVIPSLLTATAVACVLLVSVCTYFCGINKKTSQTIRFGFLWIILGLLPVSNIIPLRALFAERFLYLSVAGFGCIVAYLFSKIPSRKISFILFLIFVTGLGLKTIKRNTDWQSNNTLWQSVLDIDPENANAYNGIAMEYLKENDIEQAEQNLQTAIQYAPDNPYINNNMALVLLRQGKKHEALKLFIKTLQLDSTQALAYHNVGLLYLEENNYKQALPYLEKALELDNNYANAYNSLALCCFHLGQHERAIDAWLTASAISPDDPQPYYNIIISYLQRNKKDKALRYLNEAIKYFPENESFQELLKQLN